MSDEEKRFPEHMLFKEGIAAPVCDSAERRFLSYLIFCVRYPNLFKVESISVYDTVSGKTIITPAFQKGHKMNTK